MYQAGWSRKEIAIEPRGYAMFGYGLWTHRARGRQTPLYARALYLADAKGNPLYFCCMDLGCVTGAMRAGIVQALSQQLPGAFNEAALVLTATHTHSGPGGCSHEALYNMPTPGFRPDHVAAIVAAAVAALVEARNTAAPTELGLGRTQFADEVPVAWNRSLVAYNRNPDVERRSETQTHLALDRSMAVLSLRREGELRSLLSLFGVHATCLGNTLDRHDGDNKGYAAAYAEGELARAGVADAVAIFAQATAGDVSPHYQGPGDVARRAQIQGEAEYAYAENNGKHQGQAALSALATAAEETVAGEIDAILSYVDFTDVHAAPEFCNGERDAWTSDPCHGVAFFKGTRVDGPGMPGAVGAVAQRLAETVKALRLSPLGKHSADAAYYRRLYAAQGAKSVLLETGRKRILGQPLDKLMVPGLVDPLIAEMKRQIRLGAIKESPLVPTVLPLQIVTIGQLALVCCPGEFTTVAGRRVMQAVESRLRARGISQVLICTYSNDYMGYVTTNEEYQEQCYEGGHTLFGQWTLAAFQTCFAQLAEEILKPETERAHDRVRRPPPVPEHELALRSNLPVPF